MPPAQHTRSSVSVSRDFLKSFPGALRLTQLLSGAGLWITIASNKYEGSIHFALAVAVFFWLLTLAIYFLTLLDKQELVPLVGAERWLLTNAIYDAVATVLHISAAGIMINKTVANSFCNVEGYSRPCLYKAYLTASVFACLCCLLYFLSAIYLSCKKCRGSQTVD
ncbi:MARVEL domain-containing protein 1 [Bombina bombina]|uniref:MARVEL domain-containing protein 1 n=1 Tax=Bombina bombina TaxID=8345 RepID=UPI00235A9634|nr:MARVEL domain-containing protein 1 [Bombina bombina]